MITIEERVTKKVPGITSFFLNFKYHPLILERLKLIKCKNYSKVSKEWEIPVNELGKLIDVLCDIDDIKLTLLKTENQKTKNIKLIGDYKTTPFQYQLDGIKFGLEHNKFLLLDGMGLGKTLTAIYIAEELKQQENINHCLIVCGINSLKSNWKNEIQKHSKYGCKIIGERKLRNGKNTIGLIKDRIKQLMEPIDEMFLITNIESLRDDDFVHTLLNGPNKIDMIVVDEIHASKSSESQQGKNLLTLKSKYQIGMTGTLLINNPLDIYTPLNWIDADRSTLTNFKSNYCVYDDKFHNILIGYKNLGVLKHQLNKYSLRRTKDVLDLPTKNIIPEYLDMGDSQSRLYDNIQQGIIDDVDKVTMNTSSLLSSIARLRQVTALPSILTSEDIPSIKIDRACELVEQIIQQEEKVVVFSTFKDSVYELKERLQKYNPVIGTGDVSDGDLEANINKFQNDPDTNIFIGTWQRCGTGLTLTAASYMIFIDTAWTDAQFQQSCDRIYRIGTKKPVFIYVLICKDTIDERVWEIVGDKKAIADYVVDDTITQSGIESLKKYIKELK